MLKMGFRVIDGEIEYFAETSRGKKVSGRGRQGLLDVIGEIAFFDMRELALKQFECIDQLEDVPQLQGLSAEGWLGALGLEAVTAFSRTTSRSFADFIEVASYLEESLRVRTRNGSRLAP